MGSKRGSENLVGAEATEAFSSSRLPLAFDHGRQKGHGSALPPDPIGSNLYFSGDARHNKIQDLGSL